MHELRARYLRATKAFLLKNWRNSWHTGLTLLGLGAVRPSLLAGVVLRAGGRHGGTRPFPLACVLRIQCAGRAKAGPRPQRGGAGRGKACRESSRSGRSSKRQQAAASSLTWLSNRAEQVEPGGAAEEGVRGHHEAPALLGALCALWPCWRCREPGRPCRPCPGPTCAAWPGLARWPAGPVGCAVGLGPLGWPKAGQGSSGYWYPLVPSCCAATARPAEPASA